MLRCSGDEDRSTLSAGARAVAGHARRGDVVVDLPARFADASLMVDLAMLARRLRLRGRGVRLRGAQPHIRG